MTMHSHTAKLGTAVDAAALEVHRMKKHWGFWRTLRWVIGIPLLIFTAMVLFVGIVGAMNPPAAQRHHAKPAASTQSHRQPTTTERKVIEAAKFLLEVPGVHGFRVYDNNIYVALNGHSEALTMPLRAATYKANITLGTGAHLYVVTKDAWRKGTEDAMMTGYVCTVTYRYARLQDDTCAQRFVAN